MRSKERGLVCVIMALQLLFSSYSTAQSATPLPAVDSQGEKERNAGSEQLIIRNKYDQGSDATVAHQRKLAHGVNGGGVNGGGQPSGNTNTGGSGGSPYVQGGGGMIPTYAAGAGNNRHPHHNGGNCKKSVADPTTLVVVILVACLLLRVHKEW